MGSRPTPRPATGADRWFGIKSQIHSKLLNSLSPDQLKSLSKDGVRETIGNVVEKLVVEEQIPMTVAERESATAYDVPNVELGHHGAECSFDAIIKKYNLTDPALQKLALIVRGADTARTLDAPSRSGAAQIRIRRDGAGP